MGKMIRLCENGINILFVVNESGVVELRDFSAQGVEDKKILEKNMVYPVLEVQITGKTTRDMHGYKHNAGSASLDFTYEKHEIIENVTGKELSIYMKTEYGLCAVYHMKLFNGIPVVQTWTELENKGSEDIGLEYISSFIYQGISGNGSKAYYDKTNIYVPYNSWCCEAQWKKENLKHVNLTGMSVDGYNMPGHGMQRFYYGGKSSWSSCEYLPMGIVEDEETHEVYYFEIEHSGQWLAEYGLGYGKRLYVALSGPSESDNGWWKNLKPEDKFVTVPVAFGVVCGDISNAMGSLTEYRRAIRRKHPDMDKMNVVFNDYMNCLEGDPTEEREKQIIDKAAELGCEYYCLDAGWYDKGYWWDRVGEWKESPERFPNGLKSVCDYAKSKGMKMGLWVEIEVMGTACKLASELPDDWFICRHGKRHIDNKRYLLDFRNPEVRKYCRGVIDRLIHDYGVEYFKIDYNVTMGYGSDLYTDSCADSIMEHYKYLYEWYEDILETYPNLVIENCGSGGQRMDYGMLKLLSLQSTSDQTDYIYNSYIASNVASAVTPEQAGMWVYPYEDDEEHVVYNMVNGLLLRPYISGMVWKLSKNSMTLLKEGISLYKELRGQIRYAVPVFPQGFNEITDDILLYGLRTENTMYLSVFMVNKDEGEIDLNFAGKVKNVEVIYPRAVNCDYELSGDHIYIKMPQKAAARLLKLELGDEN